MIEVENLSKRYGSVTVASDVSFRCAPGSVTGFVGPNGAGKSTTLRMICGLAEPSSGRARVLGRPYRAIPNPGRHVGVLLDPSALHPGRTGEETLAVAAMTVGVDGARAAAVLEEVGLAGTPARKRVRTYSLGMRQRLGLALALLGEPEVLILDEPANGLDPEGIVWLRRLVRDFADRAGRVLLSSHLLREVEQVAEDLVVIGDGRVVAQGAADALLVGGVDLEELFLTLLGGGASR